MCGLLEQPNLATAGYSKAALWIQHDLGAHRRLKKVPRWARRRKIPKSDVIRALIDLAGPIETGDDLIEWVRAARGKGLG